MKWYSILAICALALLSNACERHPAAELPAEDREGTPYATESKHEGEKHEAAAEGEKHEAAPAEAAKHEEGAGEAPKFFPEKK